MIIISLYQELEDTIHKEKKEKKNTMIDLPKYVSNPRPLDFISHEPHL